MPIVGPFDEVDFTPVSEHPLKWRWTNPKWNLLPAAALAQIRPLTAIKTNQVCQSILPLIGSEQCLSGEFFEDIKEFNTSGDAEDGRTWLLDHLPPSVTELVVCWVHFDIPALVTSAEVFFSYWDDFCYPCSDNVVVWSMNDEWAAFYHDSERLWVGRRRPTTVHSS